MTSPDMPKDGDFAFYLEGKMGPLADAPDAPRQTIEQIVVEGQEPTEEFLEEWNAEQSAPELSEEEFERQALEAPGEDGDPNTPE